MTFAARGGDVAVRPPILVPVREDPDARLAFTGRDADAPGHGNVSLVVGGGDVDRNRAVALRLVGAAPDDAVFMAQVHGGDVAVVEAADRGRGARDHAGAVPGVDGLVTRETGVALAVMAADCVPVLLVDPGAGVGAVHAGRRGVVAGVVGNAVAALAPTGPGRVVAVIGPAIGGCCYEVPAGLAEQVTAVEPAARATTRRGTPGLDLPAAVAAQLARAGVARVERVAGCTHCDASWFSHRASGGGDGRAARAVGAARPPGRQVGLVIRGEGA